jgi:hypothetical protein
MGYSHGAGTAGPCRCEHDDDLYSCVTAGTVGGEMSAGSVVGARGEGRGMVNDYWRLKIAKWMARRAVGC